jgi:hypothetical protein
MAAPVSDEHWLDCLRLKALGPSVQEKEDREIKVLRSRKSYMINVHDILVGDANLESYDVITN